MADNETPVTEEQTETAPAVDAAVESVLEIINGMENFATMTRGPLGTSNGLCCQIAPTYAETVFMDKRVYLPLTLAINGKHADQRTLLYTLNNIMHTLSRRMEYPSGEGWEIVDITNGNFPRIIGREDNNDFIAACDIVIKIYY